MEKRWFDDYVGGFLEKQEQRKIGLEKEFPVVQKENFMGLDIRPVLERLVRQFNGKPFYDDFPDFRTIKKIAIKH